MTEAMATTPLVVGPDEGRQLWHLGALLSFKALTEETGGQFWALEGLAGAEMSVPLHVHSNEAEIWYVLEGEVEFTVGDDTRVAGPGSFAYIPAGVAHTFQALTPTVRWFGIGTPGGLDQWFFEIGEPARTPTLPPAAAPPDPAPIVASLRRYGTETVGPPPGQRRE